MHWWIANARNVAGIAGVISLALACSSGGSSGGVLDGGMSGGAGGAGGSSPDVHCTDLNLGCSCVADPNHGFDDATGLPRCAPPDGRGTVCCKSPGYPSTGSCECRSVGCKQDGLGCTCGTIHADGPLNVCDGATTPYCCLSPTGVCTCTSTDIGCSGGQVVATCDVFRVTQCAAGTSPTASCKGDPPAGGTGGVSATGGSGGVSGTGAGPGSGGTGGGDCPSCSAAKCSAESAACNTSAECTALTTCAANCASGDTACVQNCISNNPIGAQVFGQLANCLTANCKVECNL